MLKCILDQTKRTPLAKVNFFLKKDKPYAVPKSLIPTYVPYDQFNPLDITKNTRAEIHQYGENCVTVHLFKLKLFKTLEKAKQYAQEKGHNIIYKLGVYPGVQT